jgi:hypothetical protein
MASRAFDVKPREVCRLVGVQSIILPGIHLVVIFDLALGFYGTYGSAKDVIRGYKEGMEEVTMDEVFGLGLLPQFFIF